MCVCLILFYKNILFVNFFCCFAGHYQPNNCAIWLGVNFRIFVLFSMAKTKYKNLFYKTSRFSWFGCLVGWSKLKWPRAIIAHNYNISYNAASGIAAVMDFNFENNTMPYTHRKTYTNMCEVYVCICVCRFVSLWPYTKAANIYKLCVNSKAQA